MDLETLAENEWNEKWFRVMSKIENVNWKELSYNPNTPIAVILNHPEIEWDWEGVGGNSQLTMQIVLDNLDKKWNWLRITTNPNITSNDILQNNKLMWDWDAVITYKKLTIEIILAKPNYQWNWKNIHNSICIPLKIMLKYPQFPWYYKYLQCEEETDFKKILQGTLYPISSSYRKFLSLDFIANLSNYPWQFTPHSVGVTCVLNLEYDRLMFIERQTMLAILTTLFDFYQQPTIRCLPIPFSNIERIFMDEYLMHIIAKN